MDAGMIGKTLGWLTLVSFVALTGCGLVGPSKRTSDASARIKAKGDPKQVAVATRDQPLADPSTMIPPPPNMFPDIPAAPGRDDLLAMATPADKNTVIPATAIVSPGERAVRPAMDRARAVPEDQIPTTPEANLEALRKVHQRATERFKKIEGFEAKITRRETVGSKAMPEEVIQYKCRMEPQSFHIKWIGLEAQGRELIYVAGKYDNKVQILTGKGEGLLIRAGSRWSFPPTDSQVRSRSRYDIREGGMGLSLDWFGRVLALMENDPGQGKRMRFVGLKPRRERETGLEAVEETIPPDWEPLLPRGGKRTIYFDPEPSSPSYGLPILIVTIGDTGREVEYYYFEQFQPNRPTDADFDPDRLWKK
jgi:hypothetical protein